MTSNDWRPARQTSPPVTVDLSRMTSRDRDGYVDMMASGEPITIMLNDRRFVVPPGTHYARYGVTQEGLMVEYQDADGDWQSAEEPTP